MMQDAPVRKILLHICCGPDATVPWRSLLDEGWHVVGMFDGSNIHPRDEYLRRLEAVQTVAADLGGELIEDQYDPDSWDDAMRGYENCHEGGERCTRCFERQFRGAVSRAVEIGASTVATTLTISPHKDVARIGEIGSRIAQEHGVEWDARIWRKNDGFKRSLEISRELGLFRQTWCGCRWSRLEAESRGR